MYRTLGTRGTVFGVPSGPYAGAGRLVAFPRLPPASKRRLVDALEGTRQLSPILRSAGTRASLTVPGAVLLVATLFILVRYAWPAREPLAFAAAYVAVGLALAGMALRRTHALSYDGTSIAPGTYLFPLDVIEARADGTLRLIPIGALQEAAVAQVRARPALVLTFKDGTARTFPVGSEREAESAYASLESAQQTLERLTYGSDLADAVNLDPFFEVRIDDTWQSVEPAAAGHAGARTAAALVAGAALGFGVFVARNTLAHRAHEAQRAQMDAAIAALQARLAAQEQERSDDARRAQQEEARAAERAEWEHGGVPALDAYKEHEPSPEMGAIMAQLVAPPQGQAPGLPVLFRVKPTPCAAGAAGAPIDDAALAPMEGRLVSAFQQVLSETVPRAALPVRLVSAADPERSALTIDVELTRTGSGPQALAMAFDVRLSVPPHAAKAFRLTMPPPTSPLTHVRDRSLFAPQAHPKDTELVFARGFDRLYDELYGVFFTGPPRVPLPDLAAEDVQRTFGKP